jgi:signal transduction histidine kinase
MNMPTFVTDDSSTPVRRIGTMSSTLRPDFTLRETVLLQGEANLVAADTKRFFSRQRLERSVARDERSRVSREIHDGILQTLTAVSLRLSALSRLIESNPLAAQAMASELDQLVTTEQRSIRRWLAQDESSGVALTPASDLSAALGALCQQAESQWGLNVKLMHGPQRSVPRSIAEHVYRLIQEAIANAGKHARAAHVRVRLSANLDAVQIVVTDDGVGFPFRGGYDLTLLQKRAIGPKSLMQRVASLDGDLFLTSTMSGSTLQIALPLGARTSVTLG